MDLITLTDPRSPVSEAFRTLRTNLSFYSVDDPIRSLVVTSSAADDDKSAVAANLAVTMAQSGRSTILVDCDLRRPALHDLFHLESEPGLTNVILGDYEGLPLQATDVENLRLLASGPKPPNPADMLGSKRVDALIEELVGLADFVIFDSPPAIAVTDAAVLSAKVDGVLLVISAGKTRREHAERAKETLEKARARIVGVTLTNASQDSMVSDYYG
ncbi:MAG: CpsD/CapB family tyrosine-protein kinase [Candidatus Promineifilaceae bacterium]|jgi:capsular exopolysaccharide synthesis family protein